VSPGKLLRLAGEDRLTSPPRSGQRPGDVDDVVTAGGRVLLVPGDTLADAEVVVEANIDRSYVSCSGSCDRMTAD
jgi:hypothetical protein